MDKLLDIAFSGFWHFVGVIILLSMAGQLILNIWSRFWRHWTIHKHGYPPSHCNADGDLREKDE